MGDELASYDAVRAKRFATALAWVLDRTVPRIGTRCIPHSENLQKFLNERGLQGRSEPVLNFGIDFDNRPCGDRSALRREHGFGSEPIIMYSGVIDRFQRLDLLLGAMSHVLQAVPRARLVMVLNVPNELHEAALRTEVCRLGIEDRVALLHPGTLDEGLRMLAMADVAVVSRPVAPGFPIKLLNYMAAELPIAMYASSASGIIHRRHALLAPQDTSESLADAIIELLGNETLRQRIGLAGGQLVRERHDRRIIVGELCQAYCRLLKLTRLWKHVSSRSPVGTSERFAPNNDAEEFSPNDAEALVNATA